ncbi:hypothetical protein Tco_0104175 [Tanacetum coccineum]
MEVEEELSKPWILFTDGSSCTDGSGVGLILTNPEGMEFTYALRFKFDATNNEADVRLEELKEESINEAEILAMWIWLVIMAYHAKDAAMVTDKSRLHGRTISGDIGHSRTLSPEEDRERQILDKVRPLTTSTKVE